MKYSYVYRHPQPFSPRVHPSNKYELGLRENNSLVPNNIYLPEELPDHEVTIVREDGVKLLIQPEYQGYGYIITEYTP